MTTEVSLMCEKQEFLAWTYHYSTGGMHQCLQLIQVTLSLNNNKKEHGWQQSTLLEDNWTRLILRSHTRLKWPKSNLLFACDTDLRMICEKWSDQNLWGLLLFFVTPVCADCKYVKILWKSFHPSDTAGGLITTQSFSKKFTSKDRARFHFMISLLHKISILLLLVCTCGLQFLFNVSMRDLLGQSCVHTGVRCRSLTNMKVNRQDQKIWRIKTN